MASNQTTNNRNAWLKGGDSECRNLPQSLPHPHRLVLLGAPGVGKGTQAELLWARLGACHLSTGDIFRAAKTVVGCDCSPSMIRALDYMRRGQLVPDEIVLGLIIERNQCLKCSGGFLLDGFPRTVAQAQALEEYLSHNNIQLEAVLNYDLPLEKIVARLSGRRTCPNCKAVYHVESRPPKTKDICDTCGTALQQLEDDRPEAVRVRMDVYKKSTVPLVNFYRRRGLLISIPAEGTPEEIYARTVDALSRMRTNPSERHAGRN